MELWLLTTFRAVAKALGSTRAALLLGDTQSSVTDQTKTLTLRAYRDRAMPAAIAAISPNDRLTPLLTPLRAQHPETVGNREQGNRLRYADSATARNLGQQGSADCGSREGRGLESRRSPSYLAADWSTLFVCALRVGSVHLYPSLRLRRWSAAARPESAAPSTFAPPKASPAKKRGGSFEATR